MKRFHTDWEEFKTDKLCNAWVAAAIVGGSVVGAGVSIFGANKAASAQKDATAQAAQTARDAQAFTQSNLDTTRQTLSPYVAAGNRAIQDLENTVPNYSNIDVFTPPTDQATLEATPGYQFTRTQGLKAVQNSAATRGLGASGAALKGAATFATGLADKTYQENYDRSLGTFNANLGSKSAAFGRLSALINTGENAAAGTGAAAAAASATNTTGAGQVASAQVAGGNAAAAGYNATGTAINTGALNSGNNIGGYLAYKGLYGNGGGGDGPTGVQGLGEYS